MKKQKAFTVHYKVDAVYDAQVPADTLEEALGKAKQMSREQLDALPGTMIDEEFRITAVFE